MQNTVRIDRDRYIGGSDMAAIMGLSPFKTRWELLLEKAGLNETTFEGNEYTEYGETMEPKIREYISEAALIDFEEDKREDGFRRYHADGFGDGIVLEIKTTSQIKKTAEEYESYMVQLQMGMDMFGSEKGYLAVYERPEDFDTTFDPLKLQMFEVGRDERLIAEVRKASDSFMADLEYLKENPLASETDLPSEKSIVPIAEKALALEIRVAELKAAERELKELKAVMKEKMEEHGIDLITMDGGTRFKLVRDGEDKEVWELNETKFKSALPDLWKSYAERKVKKGRAGYVRITTGSRNKVRANV